MQRDADIPEHFAHRSGAHTHTCTRTRTAVGIKVLLCRNCLPLEFLCWKCNLFLRSVHWRRRRVPPETLRRRQQTKKHKNKNVFSVTDSKAQLIRFCCWFKPEIYHHAAPQSPPPPPVWGASTARARTCSRARAICSASRQSNSCLRERCRGWGVPSAGNHLSLHLCDRNGVWDQRSAAAKPACRHAPPCSTCTPFRTKESLSLIEDGGLTLIIFWSILKLMVFNWDYDVLARIQKSSVSRT